jgi:hypothetical protein
VAPLQAEAGRLGELPDDATTLVMRLRMGFGDREQAAGLEMGFTF